MYNNAMNRAQDALSQMVKDEYASLMTGFAQVTIKDESADAFISEMAFKDGVWQLLWRLARNAYVAGIEAVEEEPEEELSYEEIRAQKGDYDYRRRRDEGDA